MAKQLKNMLGIAAASAAVGAIASALFTPKSGREMRDTIKDKVKTGKDSAAEKIGNAKDKVTD